MTTRFIYHVTGDWIVKEVEHNEAAKYVNVICENMSDEQIGIMFWDDGTNATNIAFCPRLDAAYGVMAIDFDDLQAICAFTKKIKNAETAIEFGKKHNIYKKEVNA